ncbi:aromatic-ring-hydroxylating dioxygenase subunit beta [Muricoccus aerilatus]|uniref:aromatic-ring-hydroxylating dioxygenase subunit beta n=1 Tax=Muricoccus aerilatus TaxID=452982 RepID=UPI000ABC72DB|nr:aromatic-ring-hydroxylating dioxygenase subunit beta [Roseomonas aerilata]
MTDGIVPTRADALAIAAAVIFREARLLDRGDWDAWVGLYREDALYWVPAWLDEYRTTADPLTQVSMIHHDSRQGLEERVARIESRKSITALPLPRTVHQIGNLEVVEVAPHRIAAESVFAVHVYDPRLGKEHTRHGRYAHTLALDRDEWRIARKVITLANDRVPTVLDFYSI